MSIAVGSKQTVKLEAVRLGVGTFPMFGGDVFGYDVASGVGKQPQTLDETRIGATNRAAAALKAAAHAGVDAGLGFGLEVGLVSSAIVAST